MAPNITYAEMARNRNGQDETAGPLAYSVNRRNSAGSYFSPRRVNSSITIEEPIYEASDRPVGPRLGSSVSLSPDSNSSRRPSIEPRRPSIAQVLSAQLSKVSSRSSLSNFSGTPSRFSVSDGPAVRGYEDPVPSKAPMKRKKPKNRRRRSTQTRDHADFIVASARAPEIKPKAKDQSPLLEAISEGNTDRVKELIADKANFHDELSHRPLQLAALKGFKEIVVLLLESGYVNINDRDYRERTAIYAAKSRGHQSIVDLLLNHHAKPLSREELRIANLELEKWRTYQTQTLPIEETPTYQEQTIEGADMTTEPEDESQSATASSRKLSFLRGESNDDHLYKLQIGSSQNIKEIEQDANLKRRAAQKMGEWIKGPLSPSQLPTPHRDGSIAPKHSRYPGFGFEAPIVEIDFTENGGHRIIYPIPTVDDLLYGTRGVDSIVKGKTPSSHNTCRWYHLPANHLGWAEDLIRKIYESRDADEQKKRDVILRREPFCNDEHDHSNPEHLDPSPQARSLRPLCRNMTLDRDGTQRLSTALALHVPYAHWDTEENRAEMHHVMEQVREAKKSDIDLGMQRNIPDLDSIQNNSEWTKNEKLLCAYLYNKPPVHPRRTLDQFYYHMLEDTEQRDQDQVITRYYHNVWKRNHNYPEDDQEIAFAMPSEQHTKHHFALDLPERENTFSRLRNSGDHVTTAQPGGPTQEATRTRSKTQLPNQEDHVEQKEERHVMMIDQLWLWILDENTIITCFPQGWTQGDPKNSKENDSMDVLKNIHRYLSLVTRPPLESVHDLAQLIVYNCLAPFCRKSTPYGPMQILDVYESAIASVTDKETKIFNEFATKSKAKESKEAATNNPADRPARLYNIDEEIEQLKEIKDIQDELHILSVLLKSQESVLQDAANVLKPPAELHDSLSRSPITPRTPITTPKIAQYKDPQMVPYSSEKHFWKLYDMVNEQGKRLKGLEFQAQRANEALNHLLDLKQKQANVSEARAATRTAESTKQQGNIMVLFTLVTIIFAPLSLMTTIFSLRIVEFPPDLHMTYVLKYMFAVSVAVIVPLLGLVIYTTRLTIAKLVIRTEKRILNLKFWHRMKKENKKERWKKKLSTGDADSIETTADVADVDMGGRRRKSFWRRRRDGAEDVVITIDAEKGVNGHDGSNESH